MEKLNFVVVEKYENGKVRAHVEIASRLSNLKCLFLEGRHPENIVIIHLAKSKKEAYILCNSWNESYKEQGRLYNYCE